MQLIALTWTSQILPKHYSFPKRSMLSSQTCSSMQHAAMAPASNSRDRDSDYWNCLAAYLPNMSMSLSVYVTSMSYCLFTIATLHTVFWVLSDLSARNAARSRAEGNHLFHRPRPPSETSLRRTAWSRTKASAIFLISVSPNPRRHSLYNTAPLKSIYHIRVRESKNNVKNRIESYHIKLLLYRIT